MTDTDLSLEQLENDYWGEPEYTSGLVKTTHRVRKTPLNQLNPFELGFMIRHEMGLTHIMALAIARIEADPLAEEDCEEDLLRELMRMPESWWQQHPVWFERMRRIAQSVVKTKERQWDAEIKRAAEQYGAQLTRESQCEYDLHGRQYRASKAFVEKYPPVD